MNLGNVELLNQVTREQQTKHQAIMKFTITPNPTTQWTYPNEWNRKWVGKERILSYLHIQCQSRSLFFFPSFLRFFWFFYLFFFSCKMISSSLFFHFLQHNFFCAMKKEIAIIKRHWITHYQLTIEYIYIHHPNKTEPKEMLNIINLLTNQHTKATLNLIIRRATCCMDEMMLHRLGLKVGICVWPRANMKGSQQKWI